MPLVEQYKEFFLWADNPWLYPCSSPVLFKSHRMLFYMDRGVGTKI